jgi:hypothetical protein
VEAGLKSSMAIGVGVRFLKAANGGMEHDPNNQGMGGEGALQLAQEQSEVGNGEIRDSVGRPADFADHLEDFCDVLELRVSRGSASAGAIGTFRPIVCRKVKGDGGRYTGYQTTRLDPPLVVEED